MRAFPIAQRERSYLISLHSCCCFSFFHFFADKRLFSVGFPKVSPWLWIAIDRCIRTLNSTIRVDVGNSTGFNDPFVLLRYTQNNLESNLCSILISYFFRFELGGVRDRRRGSSFFFSDLQEIRPQVFGKVVIFFHSERATGSTEKENIPIVDYFYGHRAKFQTDSCQLNALCLLNWLPFSCCSEIFKTLQHGIVIPFLYK